MTPTHVRWLIAAALVVALVIDFRDGDPVKLLSTALLTVAAVLLASGLTDQQPTARWAMVALVGVAVLVLAYRLLVRHS